MVREKDESGVAVDELRAFGLRYPGAHTKSPWPGHLDLAVKDKTFAYLSVAGEPLSISCKLPLSAESALSLPFTTPTAYGLGKSGWVTATFPDGTPIPVDLLREWIDESYRAQAPKRLSAGLPALGEAAGADAPSLVAKPARAAAPRATRSGSAKPGSAKSGSAKSGSVKVASAKAGSAKAGSAKAGPVNVASAKAGSAKPSSVKVALAKAGSAKVASAKAGSVKVALAKAGSAKPSSVKVASAKSGSAKAGSANAGSLGSMSGVAAGRATVKRTNGRVAPAKAPSARGAVAARDHAPARAKKGGNAGKTAPARSARARASAR